jgi:hypothetical protein
LIVAIGHHVAKAAQAKEAAQTETDPITNDALADELIAEADAAPVPQPTMTMDQVLALLAATKGGGGISAEDLKNILSEVVASGATANAHAMQTALNRSNPNYVPVSPYHDADGKETIPKYTVYFGPQFAKGKGAALPKDMYSVAERDLINRFEIGDSKVARGGEWTAQVLRDGSTQELIIKVPMGTMDQRQNLPSFAMILKELLDGEMAVNPDKLAERVAELERKLAAVGAAA